LALAGVYWLNTHVEDVAVMGWYANYVIPVGAILVGLVAGAGYGIASWWLGVRIGRWLLLAVIGMQAAAYFAAEYVEYRDVRKQLEVDGMILESTGALPTFWQYYDIKARSFQSKGKGANDRTEPLGVWGYVFVGLAAVGFIAGGLIAPAVLFSKPYCEPCQRYMKTKALGTLPASVPAEKVKKLSPPELAAYEARLKAATDAAEAAVARLRTAAESGDATAIQAELAAGNASTHRKLPARVEVSLVHCRECGGGRLVQTLVSGSGDKTTQAVLAEVPVTRGVSAPLLA
jgi:hypothetical protein